MNNSKNIEDGINGLGIGVINTNAKDFKALQKSIQEKAAKQTEKQILENKLLSLRFQMESYLEKETPETIQAGWFLKKFLNQLGIKKKSFAQYLGIQESNLSALFTGKRKINIDLAIKLGAIFRVDPILWINIQTKNELFGLKQAKMKAYQKFTLKDLLKKVG